MLRGAAAAVVGWLFSLSAAAVAISLQSSNPPLAHAVFAAAVGLASAVALLSLTMLVSGSISRRRQRSRATGHARAEVEAYSTPLPRALAEIPTFSLPELEGSAEAMAPVPEFVLPAPVPEFVIPPADSVEATTRDELADEPGSEVEASTAARRRWWHRAPRPVHQATAATLSPAPAETDSEPEVEPLLVFEADLPAVPVSAPAAMVGAPPPDAHSLSFDFDAAPAVDAVRARPRQGLLWRLATAQRRRRIVPAPAELASTELVPPAAAEADPVPTAAVAPGADATSAALAAAQEQERRAAERLAALAQALEAEEARLREAAVSEAVVSAPADPPPAERAGEIPQTVGIAPLLLAPEPAENGAEKGDGEGHRVRHALRWLVGWDADQPRPRDGVLRRRRSDVASTAEETFLVMGDPRAAADDQRVEPAVAAAGSAPLDLLVFQPDANDQEGTVTGAPDSVPDHLEFGLLLEDAKGRRR